jgi:hypothetical protein
MEMTGDRRQSGFSKDRPLVSKEKVEEYVVRWTAQFRKEFSDDELTAITTLYHQDIKNLHWTDKRFESAAISVTTMCRFFPTVADIVEADQHNQLKNARQSEAESQAFNYERTDADTAHGREQLKNIFAILEGKISPKDGEARSWELLNKHGRV